MRQDLRDWLTDGAGRGWRLDRFVETSISWLFLYREAVLKLKRPVDFGFVDFTTLEKRRWAIERELAFNKPGAPDIYRCVHAIRRTGDGEFSLDGRGDTLDWALEMRRFDEREVLSEQPHVVRGDFAEELGRRIARFHAEAPFGEKGGGGAGLAAVITSNARQFSGLAGLDQSDLQQLTDGMWRRHAEVEHLLDERLAGGFVRRCHGDLHLGNILLERDRPVLFDCIEFNDAIAEIDVLYDLAFLLMDLHHRNEAAGANRVLNGWLDEAAGHFPSVMWAGLAALPLFQAVRAAIRAHVCGHSQDIAQADLYVRHADAHLRPAVPRVVAVGGLSGSGKSSLARALAPRLQPSPGAVVLRTDEIRKRLAGVPPTTRLSDAAYTPEMRANVYEEMFDGAQRCLSAGWPVILDAVFLEPELRVRAEAVAAKAKVPFTGLWLDAPADVLKARLEARGPDASDANAQVLEAQLARNPADLGWCRLAAGNLDQLRSRALGCLAPSCETSPGQA